ncbi:MAG: diaminopimelate decarboxylase [Deltaproteobacteria bacterium RIFCSPLOWO2_12_FULL_40_28]|nr:MAG: diaminopimelate decarboxylase [Deltaproteobacteria bacterium RIFCSPHIGHO2_02_FULL_40_28]OGQ19063.1 MAG: diaminopimelate decarboxylase [Deltaproteobacteria bacterium RIFCSPHIGHO2_12_FULL_40_32]OGQ40235.1 MAG: diaminopimelate decarboxylase [Deltaproteobacteria bacterium RIFCSPLOWO2_02_FULL_40_36]OGQ53506.1 MAG: diaminopimelate decarboxylase [Deltaproteobacteria bacterium RIFCSPLOWO2_12_FULL_40_28]
MNTFFNYKNQILHCEDVNIPKLAHEFGTPLYVYSHGALKNQFQLFDTAFKEHDHLICFSMKANSNGSILKTFVNLGGGIDVVTGGELFRALKAGCAPKRIVFSGVGKSREEMKQALNAGILQFNVESIAEMNTLNEVAKSLDKKAPVALRVNPDVDPQTHAYISTGLKESKFGISHEKTAALYEQMVKMSHLEIVGIACHIGSQLTTVEPFVEALRKILSLVEVITKKGIKLKYLDLGGGLGITYHNEKPPHPQQYAQALLGELKHCDLKLIFEPGRFLVGNTAILVSQVLYNKERDSKSFVIVDAASNDLMRPALYDAYHGIVPVKTNEGRKEIKADVVGPICETGDFLAKDRVIPIFESGELMAFNSAGAYGFSMSSTYNSRPKAAEVLVSGNQYALIREREKMEDLIRGEKIPDFV